MQRWRSRLNSSRTSQAPRPSPLKQTDMGMVTPQYLRDRGCWVEEAGNKWSSGEGTFTLDATAAAADLDCRADHYYWAIVAMKKDLLPQRFVEKCCPIGSHRGVDVEYTSDPSKLVKMWRSRPSSRSISMTTRKAHQSRQGLQRNGPLTQWNAVLGRSVATTLIRMVPRQLARWWSCLQDYAHLLWRQW